MTTDPAPPGYERPDPALRTPMDHPAYASTALRRPTRPLVLLPHTLTEVTGPVLGDGRVTKDDADLTQWDVEPLFDGDDLERI